MPFCSHAPWPCLTSPATFLRLPPGLRVHAFSSSAGLLAEAREKSPYEILGVPVTATTQDIKKRFYSLSIAHHPDKNPDDPEAHSKFAAISSAYHVLGDTSKRARYDRDNDIHRQPTAAGASGLRGANANRASYAGSRPPSGLSKRRGPFRGPPPSFYAHGGYGNTAHGNASSSSSHQTHHQHWHEGPHHHQHGQGKQPPPGSSTRTSSSSTEDPTSFIRRNTIHHFDASSHFRTQSHEDARRRMRRMRAIERAKMQAREHGVDVDGYEDSSSTVRFFVVLGIIAVAFLGVNVGRAIEFAPHGRNKTSERSGSVDGSAGNGGGRRGMRSESAHQH